MGLGRNIKTMEQELKRRKKIGESHKGIRLGQKLLEKTKKKISKSNTGKLSSQWKGKEAKYQAFHIWIRTHYGNATKCENKRCLKKSFNYEWALIKGKKHGHDIKRYIQLCKSCHRIYDEINKKTRKRVV
ncbi:MAG: hypothetical protein AABY22_03320 [Nanoarchaeota archaeon]